MRGHDADGTNFSAMIVFMVEKSLWLPVADEQALKNPVAVRLLDHPLVLWRDSSGALHAWTDRCPHRGARLSMGHVVQDRLQCPYHGWQFDTQGQCRRVPALPEFTPPAGYCASVHAVQSRHGLIWVRLEGQGSESGPPPFPDESSGLRLLNCGPYEVATSAPRTVENFLDMAHFSFVHEGWLGAADHPEIEPYEVEETQAGLRARRCIAWQPRSNLHSTAAAQVEYTYEVTGPYSAMLTKIPEAGSTRLSHWQEAIGLFICPVSAESSRVWFRLAMADHESSDEALASFQHTIFCQDQPVLESQQPKRLPLEPRSELHTSVDRLSTAYRRYLRQLNISFGVC
jgi:phenylpropionate dioxygenase-like ring-hydroxylating dioxygenase large terminal subunit